MNAGTIQCKCGIHYTARDPHPLCKNCSARSCSRSHPCSFCLRLSPSEWDLWLDQEARTSDFGSKRFLEESSSPATEGLGSSQDDKSDSNKESPGNSRSGSSGEVLSLASHTGGEARIANLETGLSSLQASLSNISSLLSSRLGPSGTKTPPTSLPLGTPPLGGVPVSGVVDSRSSSSLLPVTPVSVGSPVLSGSQPFFSLPSFQPIDENRFAGEQRVYPTEVEVRFENQVEDRLLDDSMEQDGGSEEVVHSSTLSPPFRGWNRDPRSHPSREPGIGGYQALGPGAPHGGLPFGPPLTSPQGFSAPPWRDSSFNPMGTGVRRTDHQIGPLEVAVTTGTTTTVVSTVSYHLTSLSSDTRTSFSVPGSRCSGLVPTMSNPSVPIQAQPPVGQVEAALDVLRGAGYPLPDYALHDSTLEDPAPELYDNSLRFKDPTSLDSRVSLDYLRRDIRSRHPSMSSPLTTLPSKPHSVGISRFFPPEETVNNNLPLSPAISQWLDVQKDILLGKGGRGKTQRTLPYAKGSYPRFPALSTGRYLPVDADTLFTCPRAPPSWYQVCSTQGPPVPTAFQMPIKETEELVCAAGRDLAVISELDWLTSGASHLLGQMAATPALSPYMSSITLLQRYALETCRSVEMLERSSTARYANHLWRLRDGHLSRLHNSVPKQTKESLRQAPLLGTHLFPEETVAVAARNLRGDVQHLNLSNSLKFFSAPKKQPKSNRSSSQPPKAQPLVQQPVLQAAGRGRGSQASRGKPNKTPRGRGRGGQKQKHS